MIITRVEEILRGNATQITGAAPPTRATEAVAVQARVVRRELELRDFQAGQRVRILNPERGAENTGIVMRIGRRFVEISRSRSKDTKRIPRNLEILDDEE